MASILGTCPISLVAVFASLRSNRLSEATGLDFEVVLQGARLLWRGRKDHQELELREPLPMGTVAALMPFKADTFDTLKDVVSGALCIMSESWALPLAGFASLAWLPWVHSTLLRDTECVADISGSYFPFASAQPVHDESEVLLAESGELFARALQANNSRQDQASALGSRAAGCLCPILFFWNEGPSLSPSCSWQFHSSKQPLAGYATSSSAGGRCAPQGSAWRCFGIGQRPTANTFAGNHLARRRRAARNSLGTSAQGHPARASDCNDLKWKTKSLSSTDLGRLSPWVSLSLGVHEMNSR